MNVITVNGEEVLKGDPSTICVIFNNLASGDKAYRHSIEALLDVDIKGSVCLLDSKGRIAKKIRVLD